MELKKCTKCGQWKDIEEFAWKDKAKGKRRAQCRECTSKEDKERYLNDPKRREAIRAVHNNLVNLLKSYVRDIKQHSQCAICGDARWYVLDFHHLSNKESNISEKVRTGCSLETLKKEIEKCICVCANCHREIHYKERLLNGEE